MVYHFWIDALSYSYGILQEPIRMAKFVKFTAWELNGVPCSLVVDSGCGCSVRGGGGVRGG